MRTIGLRQLATALGVAAGLVELFLVATAVAETGRSADYAGIFVYILPLVIIGGAIAVSYVQEAAIGAGIMIVGFATQHVMVHIRGASILPMILAVLAVALAMRVDAEQRKSAAAP
ncbi:MAG: hypothetical protein IRZ09_02170 [Variibacter sp.]|nr:hypothetical protein [Variibacter sp.]